MMALFIPLFLSEPDGILADPTYKALSRLVGGHWEAKLGPDAVLRQQYRFAVDGKMIRGEGSVSVGGKTMLHIQANFGWDPIAKKVTYVDFHNHDTIFMGYVTLEKDDLRYAFTEFANIKKEHLAHSHFVDDNHYEFVVEKEVITLERKPGECPPPSPSNPEASRIFERARG